MSQFRQVVKDEQIRQLLSVHISQVFVIALANIPGPHS